MCIQCIVYVHDRRNAHVFAPNITHNTRHTNIYINQMNVSIAMTFSIWGACFDYEIIWFLICIRTTRTSYIYVVYIYNICIYFSMFLFSSYYIKLFLAFVCTDWINCTFRTLYTYIYNVHFTQMTDVCMPFESHIQKSNWHLKSNCNLIQKILSEKILKFRIFESI